MMELNLKRIDYTQIGVTSRNCMKLLPDASDKGTQKVVVADNDGVVTCFGFKKGEIQTFFKTLPGSAINRLTLGGALGSPQDKIFVASGNQVRGYSKKGKQFLLFDTNLTEPIQSMQVIGNDLFVAGDFIYNHYRDCQDQNYYLCGEKINDILVLPLNKVKMITPILACEDRVLRMLSDSQLLYEVEVPGPPNCLALYQKDGGPNGNLVLYGSSEGTLGLVELNRIIPRHIWQLKGQQHGGILSIDNYDMTGDGIPDLIIARDDGSIEVYSYSEVGEPCLKFQYLCNDSVTAIQGGIVGESGYNEIIATTYSGWIFGLSTNMLRKESVHISAKSPIVITDPSLVTRANVLKQEIEELQEKVFKERKKYQELTQGQGTNFSSASNFNIHDKFALNHDEAAYMLCIEVQTAIDNVLLQSDVPLHLLDSDKNSAVVSYSACDTMNGNYLLATYRCQANTTRLETKVRSIEGQHGTLKAYITPRLQPKSCQVCHYQIKPLSLHKRAHSISLDRPFNVLTLSGKFSMAEIHSWVVFCLPEVPERVPSTDTAEYNFISTFLNTVLSCSYKKGEAIFKSDNISTIAILRDVLTREATKKKIRLDMSSDINEESIIHALSLIHPKLEYQLNLSKKVRLIDALKELQLHEKEISFMSPEYKEILEQEENLLEEFKRQPCHLERLYGIVTDLYIDKYKFKGVNVKTRVPTLINILENYDYQELVDFFQQRF